MSRRDSVHIRDLMRASKEKLKKDGIVPNVTMCGLDDPNMNQLTFGDPAHVLHRKVANPCQQCIQKWRSQAESDSSWKRTYNEFRKIIHKAIRAGYGGRR